MKERIQQILEAEGLNPARFAEMIGAQRATLSHILSGRNNVSLEITMRILDTFPRLSPEWFLRGKGEMYIKEGEPSGQTDLFSNPTLPTHPPQALPDSEDTPPVAGHPPVTVVKIASSETTREPERNVTKIMLFYTDNTFDTFIPEGGRKS